MLLNFIFLAAAGLLLPAARVLARDPSADELNAVEQAFIDAGLMPDVVPEMALEAFFILTFTDAAGNEVLTLKDPGFDVSEETAAIIPVMATQGIHHLKGSRIVAFVIDPDDPMGEIRQMFAQNLSVREDSTFPDVDHGAHLLNNIVTHTPPANPYLPPDLVPGSGTHRFTWLAYKQPAVFDFSFLDVEDRTHFNVAEFAAETGLGLPVAATFFNIVV